MAKVTDIHVMWGQATVLKATAGDWVESSGVLTIDKATWTLADTTANTWVSTIGRGTAPKLAATFKQTMPVMGGNRGAFFPAQPKVATVTKSVKLTTFTGRNAKCVFKKA